MSDLEMFADTLTLIREDDSIQALNQFRCCRRRMTARGSAAISLSDADRFGVGRNGLSLTSSGRPRRTRAVYGDGQRRRPGREYPTRAQPARLPDDQSLHPGQGGADFPGSTGRTGTGPFPATPDSPAQRLDDRTDQGGNYWTLSTTGIENFCMLFHKLQSRFRCPRRPAAMRAPPAARDVTSEMVPAHRCGRIDV
jgi:hypothetical protein